MHDLSELALTKQSPSGLIESALGEEVCPIILFTCFRVEKLFKMANAFSP